MAVQRPAQNFVHAGKGDLDGVGQASHEGVEQLGVDEPLFRFDGILLLDISLGQVDLSIRGQPRQAPNNETGRRGLTRFILSLTRVTRTA